MLQLKEVPQLSKTYASPEFALPTCCWQVNGHSQEKIEELGKTDPVSTGNSEDGAHTGSADNLVWCVPISAHDAIASRLYSLSHPLLDVTVKKLKVCQICTFTPCWTTLCIICSASHHLQASYCLASINNQAKAARHTEWGLAAYFPSPTFPRRTWWSLWHRHQDCTKSQIKLRLSTYSTRRQIFQTKSSQQCSPSSVKVCTSRLIYPLLIFYAVIHGCSPRYSVAC